MLEGLLIGLQTALPIQNLLMVIGGCLIGTFIGMLPGLGPMSIIAIMIPIAISIALASGANPRPFILAIALAASLAFVTPIGYQTNLMVMGPGGYRPSDYIKCGLPLTIVVAATAILFLKISYQL